MTAYPGHDPDEWDRRAARPSGHHGDEWPDTEADNQADTAEDILSALGARDRIADANRARTETRTYGDREDTGPYGTGDRTEVGRSVRLTAASDIPLRRPVWLWQDRIPASAITLMSGREGIGKSLALAWVSARVTRGQLPGVLRGQPRAVIYAATEDSWSHTIGPRLVAAGANLDMVFRADVLTDETMIGALSLPLDIAALFGEAEARGVALLACDPLLSLLSDRIDANKEQQLRRALEPLKSAAELGACTVVGLAHWNKSGGTDPLSMIIGARAWTGVARAVHSLARDPADEDGGCVLSLDKCNVGPTWPAIPALRYVIRTKEVDTQDGLAEVGALEFTGETTRGVRDILAEAATDPADRTERDEAAAWLTDYLTEHGGQAPREELIKAARAEGFAEATLKRARTRAGVSTVSAGFPRRTTWHLEQPKQLDQSEAADPTEDHEP
jgi:hypothetical protein